MDIVFHARLRWSPHPPTPVAWPVPRALDSLLWPRLCRVGWRGFPDGLWPGLWAWAARREVAGCAGWLAGGLAGRLAGWLAPWPEAGQLPGWRLAGLAHGAQMPQNAKDQACNATCNSIFTKSFDEILSNSL